MYVVIALIARACVGLSARVRTDSTSYRARIGVAGACRMCMCARMCSSSGAGMSHNASLRMKMPFFALFPIRALLGVIIVCCCRLR